jgi:hypothetical protein
MTHATVIYTPFFIPVKSICIIQWVFLKSREKIKKREISPIRSPD